MFLRKDYHLSSLFQASPIMRMWSSSVGPQLPKLLARVQIPASALLFSRELKKYSRKEVLENNYTRQISLEFIKVLFVWTLKLISASIIGSFKVPASALHSIPVKNMFITVKTSEDGKKGLTEYEGCYIYGNIRGE